jgi:hypothetical protein
VKFKFIKDTLIYGVTHKAEETFKTDSYDRLTEGGIDWCIGHGMFFPLKLGVDIDVIQDIEVSKCPTCGK